MAALPTREQMFANADRELEKASLALMGALDWLRSDWQPVGSALSDAQAARRMRLQREVPRIITAIERLRREG